MFNKLVTECNYSHFPVFTKWKSHLSNLNQCSKSHSFNYSVCVIIYFLCLVPVS